MTPDLRDGRPWLLGLRLARAGERAPAPHESPESDVHVWRSQDGGDIAYGFRRDGRCWMHWPSFATYGFAPDDPFVTAYPAPGPSLASICDVFSRSVLPMALQSLGFEALHGSSIVSDAGVMVFAGQSKAGKSTIAFGLSRRGYQQWSDDAVVFRMPGGMPEAVPLPFAVRLRQDAPTGAAPLGPDFHWPDRVPTRIAGVCLVSQLGRGAPGAAIQIRTLGRAEAFPGILAQAHEFDPAHTERRHRMLDVYLDVAAGVPMFEVAFRPEPSQFERLLDEIEERIGMRGGRVVRMKREDERVTVRLKPDPTDVTVRLKPDTTDIGVAGGRESAFGIPLAEIQRAS